MMLSLLGKCTTSVSSICLENSSLWVQFLARPYIYLWLFIMLWPEGTVLFTVHPDINWDGREKLMVLLSFGVHALEVGCTLWLLVEGLKCPFCPALGRGAFRLHTGKV